MIYRVTKSGAVRARFTLPGDRAPIPCPITPIERGAMEPVSDYLRRKAQVTPAWNPIRSTRRD